MTRFIAALAVALAALSPAAAISAPAAEVRFCPAGVARTYPLDSLRGVQSLNLQNVAVLNTGAEPVEISALDIDLLRAGQVIDRRTLSNTMLASAARGAQAAKAQGLMDVLAFQTCDGRLMGKSALAESPTLGSGQALLVMQQVFAWKGARDELRVTARGKSGEAIATGAVKLDGASTKTHFRWPLKSGAWLAATASSFHTTHRWAVPEEFALDIARIGADGRTFRTNGEKHTDFRLEQIERHLFEFEPHRIPGDAHVHFLGGSVTSFGDGIVLKDGDEVVIQWDGFGLPLRNRIEREPAETRRAAVLPL